MTGDRKGNVFMVYDNGYDDPAPLYGPYTNEAEALAEYRRRLIEAGADLDEGMPDRELYVTDDAVRLAKLQGR